MGKNSGLTWYEFHFDATLVTENHFSRKLEVVAGLQGHNGEPPEEVGQHYLLLHECEALTCEKQQKENVEAVVGVAAPSWTLDWAEVDRSSC